MLAALKDVSIDGRLIAYREAGHEPPIVFLHGLGGNSQSWEPQFAAYSGGHRVVAWDMPGFGGSELPETPFTATRDYSALAAAVIRLVQHFLQMTPPIIEKVFFLSPLDESSARVRVLYPSINPLEGKDPAEFNDYSYLNFDPAKWQLGETSKER